MPKHCAFQLGLKRLLDVLFALALLCTTLLPLIIVAMIIKLTDGGDIIFKQYRIGKDEKPFPMLKLRSMYRHAESIVVEGELFKDANDKRITPIGRFIRKTSMDELPQLINVLRGDMSVVGPRPLEKAEFDQVNLKGIRGHVLPGITGAWQISGRIRGERDSIVVESEDNHYVENWSIWLDLKIALKTVSVVLFCRGAA